MKDHTSEYQDLLIKIGARMVGYSEREETAPDTREFLRDIVMHIHNVLVENGVTGYSKDQAK